MLLQNAYFISSGYVAIRLLVTFYVGYLGRAMLIISIVIQCPILGLRLVDPARVIDRSLDISIFLTSLELVRLGSTSDQKAKKYLHKNILRGSEELVPLDDLQPV